MEQITTCYRLSQENMKIIMDSHEKISQESIMVTDIQGLHKYILKLTSGSKKLTLPNMFFKHINKEGKKMFLSIIKVGI